MLFKNIRFYCSTKPLAFDAQTLEERLAQHAFTEGESFSRTRMGWVSPLGADGQTLTHALGDYIMICARKDEKLLPASVINDELAKKVEEIEEKQGRKVFRKEKLQLKDDVTAALLPRAFTRTRLIFAYFDLRNNLLIVNSSSATVADEITAALRESLDTLPVTLPVAEHSPNDVMTRWLESQQASDGFVINQDCELFNPLEDSNVVRCKGQDLYSDEIKAHLEAGKQVKKLGLLWNDTLNCVVSADLVVSQIKFEDVILDEAGEAEDAAAQFDQDFAIMTGEFSKFLRALFSAFGGVGSLKKD
ncbi:MAG: recombination-associated protein RdgC [Pseudohongiellaceae bacterium]|nr:recombination-associated protein RdgC [Pseudohongiellaceae bacterium]